MKRNIQIQYETGQLLTIEDGADVDILHRTITVSEDTIRMVAGLLPDRTGDIIRKGVQAHGFTPSQKPKRKKRNTKKRAKATNTRRPGYSENGKRLGRPPKRRA